MKKNPEYEELKKLEQIKKIKKILNEEYIKISKINKVKNIKNEKMLKFEEYKNLYEEREKEIIRKKEEEFRKLEEIKKQKEKIMILKEEKKINKLKKKRIINFFPIKNKKKIIQDSLLNKFINILNNNYCYIIQTTSYLLTISTTLKNILINYGLNVKVMFKNEIEDSILENDKNNYYIFLWIHELDILPKEKFIIYNLEPLTRYKIFPDFELKNINSKIILQSYNNCDIILDYSKTNINKYPEKLKKKGIYFPIPFLDNKNDKINYLYNNEINFKDREIDILFFGSLNERRNKIFKELNKIMDLNIEFVYNVFGEKLYEKIKNSKIVLNIHFDKTSILETARLHYCLRKHDIFIISEESCEEDREIMKFYNKLVEFIPVIDENKEDGLNILIEKIYKIIDLIENNDKIDNDVHNDNNFKRRQEKIKNVLDLNKNIYSSYIFFDHFERKSIIPYNLNNENGNFFNILIRNTYRPTAFKKCIESVLNQTYQNFRIIMCYDDDNCLDYLNKYKNDSRFEIFKTKSINNKSCFYNLYCNELLNKVKNGWILFLDDDDMYTNTESIKIINKHIQNENNILFWKFKRPDKLIYPPTIKIERNTVASCGYCFHSKYKNLSKWTVWQGGDFDYVEGLLKKNKFDKIFINNILTKTTFNDMKVGNFGNKENYIIKNNEKKFSIIMAYYNRKKQTILTLNQLERLYGNKYDFEVVIVDDCSEKKEKLNDIINNFSFKIKYIELKNKTWINSVIPFNVAITNISSDVDIVIFQHPEIYHTTSIFDYIKLNLNNSNYLTFPIYSSPSFYHNDKISMLDSKSINFIEDFVNKIDLTEFKFDYHYYISKYNDVKNLNYTQAINHYKQIGCKEKRSCNKYNSLFPDKVIYKFKGWFNHHIHRPCNYNFLSAITIKNLKKIGGFNNKMQNGMWYEDDEILQRIKRITNIKLVDDINYMAIHLFHNGGTAENVFNQNSRKLRKKNYLILKETINNKKIYCSPTVNIENIENIENINYNVSSEILYIPNCICVFCINKKRNKTPKNYTLFNHNTNKTLVYYDYGYGLWNGKISMCYNTKKLISNSNHFIDLKLQDINLFQEYGDNKTKSHKIYSRIQNNYNLLLIQQPVEIINDKCIFLNNSFTGVNAGHDLYYILDIIRKFINSNVKFIMYNEAKNTNIFKIINLIIPSNRLIFINEKKIYLFENEIFDYEHNYYNSANYSFILNKLHSKIKKIIEKFKIPYELHNKNIIVLKNNYFKQSIVRNKDTFVINRELINYILKKNWYILDIESSEYFYLNCYLLMHAKNIISCQRGISAFNQIFYNKNANFYALLVSYDNIIHINNLQEITSTSGKYMKNPDYICNNLYHNLIDTVFELPITLNNNIVSTVFNKINNIGKSKQKQNIYIYNLVDLDLICSTFPTLEPEQDIFDHFLIQIKNNYNIVSNIEDADLAFIPIDFVKLIYWSPHYDYSIVPEGCPIRPRGTGKFYKENHIKYFWG